MYAGAKRQRRERRSMQQERFSIRKVDILVPGDEHGEKEAFGVWDAESGKYMPYMYNSLDDAEMYLHFCLE
jgi:hypothetical protein